MVEYEYDVFYELPNDTLENKINVINWAKKNSFDWCVDILNCNISWVRKRIEMSWEDILEKFNDDCFFRIIYRKGYVNWKNNKNYTDTWCLNIVFRTTSINNEEYFLWILCKEEFVEKIVKKFKLKIL